MIEQDKAVQLLQDVIRAETINPPGNELRTAQILVQFFKNHGIEVFVDEFSPGRANLLARLPGKVQRGSFVFNGHMDVVPVTNSEWDVAPFSAEIRDGELYGRGASDMKSGLVAMAIALVNLQERGLTFPGDVLFAATAGEEVDCFGARRFVEQDALRKAEALLIAEPTNGDVIRTHKGAVWLEIHTYGKAAHGSMPLNGANAVKMMQSVLNELGEDLFTVEDPLLGLSTLTPTLIGGGVKINIVPSECHLQIDIRTVPGEEQNKLLENITSRLDSLRKRDSSFKYEIEVLSRRPPIITPGNSEFFQIAEALHEEFYRSPSVRCAIPYFTDGSIFTEKYPDLPILLYGPGDDKLAHQANERVNVQSYVRSIQFYEQLVLHYFE